ncbi:MAG: hypothetical protein OEV78_11785 [Spirochaetia bacterium]|nr:hypothetical protein [Spirochaetia bacterium]
MAKKIKNFNEYSEKTQKGAELFNNKKYEDALDVFLELSEYNTTNYKVFETLALIYIKLNNINAADEAYKKALELFSLQSGVTIKSKSFDEVVAGLETMDNLKLMYEKECENSNHTETKSEGQNEDITVHRLPLMIGMRYMAEGDFKKAEELLVQHRNKYFHDKKL